MRKKKFGKHQPTFVAIGEQNEKIGKILGESSGKFVKILLTVVQW